MARVTKRQVIPTANRSGPPEKTGLYVRATNGLKLRDRRVRRLVRRMFGAMRWLEPSDRPACHAWAELEVLATRVYAELRDQGLLNARGEARRLLHDYRQLRQAQATLSAEHCPKSGLSVLSWRRSVLFWRANKVVQNQAHKKRRDDDQQSGRYVIDSEIDATINHSGVSKDQEDKNNSAKTAYPYQRKGQKSHDQSQSATTWRGFMGLVVQIRTLCDSLWAGAVGFKPTGRGVAAETKIIRLGTQGTQTAAYIAGISGSSVMGGDAVVVNSSGRLGMVMSSARYKKDVRDMGTKSADLLKLRPVTYRYKNDPTGTLQYGLVAEEVARVYPELVSYGADGKVMTVHYLTLTAMLLNELQKQAIENQRQARQIHQLTERSAQESERIEQQAIQNQRLSTQVAQLKGMFEQAMAAQRGPRSLAAAFNR